MSLQILIRGFLDNAEFVKIIYMWTERFMKEQEQEMEQQREKICQLQSKISVDNIGVLAPIHQYYPLKFYSVIDIFSLFAAPFLVLVPS